MRKGLFIAVISTVCWGCQLALVPIQMGVRFVDTEVYEALAEGRYESLLAPWGYRVLTPSIAGALSRSLGLSIEKGFTIVNLSSLLGTLLALAYLIRNKTNWIIAFVVASASFSYAIRRLIVLSGSAMMTDAFSLFAITLSIAFLLEKKWIPYSILMTIGSLNRESQMFVVVVHLALTVFEDQKWKDLLYNLPAISVTVALRVLIPVVHSGYIGFYNNPAEWFRAGVIDIFRYVILTFGILWVVAVYQSCKRNVVSYVFWAMLSCAIMSVLCTCDIKRMISVVLPALFLSVADFMEQKGWIVSFLVVLISVTFGWWQFAAVAPIRMKWMLSFPGELWIALTLFVALVLVLSDRKRRES